LVANRRSLEETWDYLSGNNRGRRDEQGRPRLHDHIPTIYDEPRLGGLEFFRSGANDTALENLTIPRTFFGKSDMQRVSFRNTDLSQSTLCWSDFIECDFTDADLTCCDMRASIFRNCRFVRCQLVAADLRHSSFETCDFTDADLSGAVTCFEQDGLPVEALSDEQHEQVDDRVDPGELPAGG
jgi:uncharacterized protein YjbI with pentapeptide repeats